MKKLIHLTGIIYLLFLVTDYVAWGMLSLPPKEVAFVTFMVLFGTLILALIGNLGATIMFSALIASMATLAALSHLSGAGEFIQLVFPALMAVVALWAIKELQIPFWAVFLDFILLAGAMYFFLVGFPAGFFQAW